MISPPSCSRWEAALRLFVVVELTIDSFGGALKEIDRGPQKVGKVRFEARVLQRDNERVKDVGNGSRDEATFGQWPAVGLVFEGAMAVELELLQEMLGRGRLRAGGRCRLRVE